MNFHRNYQPPSDPNPNFNNHSRLPFSSGPNSSFLKTRFSNQLQSEEALVDEDSDLERSVLFATADPIVLQGLNLYFDVDGWKCHHCESINELTKPLATGTIEVVVICDSILGNKDDLSRLQEIIQHNPLTAVIALVDQADSNASKSLTKLPLFDIFIKPFSPQAVLFRAYDAVAEFFGGPSPS